MNLPATYLALPVACIAVIALVGRSLRLEWLFEAINKMVANNRQKVHSGINCFKRKVRDFTQSNRVIPVLFTFCVLCIGTAAFLTQGVAIVYVFFTYLILVVAFIAAT